MCGNRFEYNGFQESVGDGECACDDGYCLLYDNERRELECGGGMA